MTNPFAGAPGPTGDTGPDRSAERQAATLLYGLAGGFDAYLLSAVADYIKAHPAGVPTDDLLKIIHALAGSPERQPE